MKQLFYAVAVVVLLFFAVRLMSKVKDVPEQESEQEHFEDEEDADVIANRECGEAIHELNE